MRYAGGKIIQALQQGEFLLTLRAVLLRSLLACVFKILPYRVWRPLILSALKPSAPITTDARRVERVLSCVHRSDGLAPGRCLERTVTAWLLMHHDAVCRVRLGVALKAPGDPFAHAALEVDGRIVFGEPNQTEFAMLELESAGMGAGKPK
ncbi:MAG TPA: lasso peptide biosynthesis B2 protein [Rhizomicrobium sp.]|nr:lasso peptide biosynthesis B2 protein [Rhizomicrobium sp.]